MYRDRWNHPVIFTLFSRRLFKTISLSFLWHTQTERSLNKQWRWNLFDWNKHQIRAVVHDWNLWKPSLKLVRSQKLVLENLTTKAALFFTKRKAKKNYNFINNCVWFIREINRIIPNFHQKQSNILGFKLKQMFPI